jgi:hypothetical protein
MLGVAGEQVESVWQKRQNGEEAALSPCRAPRQVHDKRTSSDAANSAPKGCKWRLLNAMKANLLGETGDETVADLECGFRSHVAFREASATCRQYQVCTLSGVSESGDE